MNPKLKEALELSDKLKQTSGVLRALASLSPGGRVPDGVVARSDDEDWTRLEQLIMQLGEFTPPVQAVEFLSHGEFPEEQGAKLASALLAIPLIDWTTLSIDVTGLYPAYVISAYFNGFLQRVHERRPELLVWAKEIRWLSRYPFQTENVQRWMKDFEPRLAAEEERD